MKGPIWTLALAAFLWCTALFAAQETYDEMVDEYYETIPISHPLLQKVFPGVQFFGKTPPSSIERALLLGAQFEGRRYYIPVEFNELYSKVANRAKASQADRAEAFLRLHLWRNDPNLQIVSSRLDSAIEIPHGKEVIRLDYHRLVVALHWNDKISTLQIFVTFNQDQLGMLHVKTESGHEYDIPGPKLIWSLDGLDEFGLEIFGADPKTYGNIDHYYISVKENGQQIQRNITLRVRGLEPGWQYCLVVHPFYWIDNSEFYSSGNITAPSNGIIESVWQPDDSHTGVAFFQLKLNDHVIWYDNTKWLIPEKRLGGPASSPGRVYYN